MRRNYARFNAQHAAGRLAVKVFCCSTCDAQYPGQQKDGDKRWFNPVQQCQSCGGIQFFVIDSKTEARRWAELRMLEKRGQVADLKRQVWIDLYASGPSGERIKVSAACIDFAYFDAETQEYIYEDAKPRIGVDDLADLKFKIAAANGRPITVWTPPKR